MIEIDHSGMGAAYLRSHPETPIAHEMGAPCATCDPQAAPSLGAAAHAAGARAVTNPYRPDTISWIAFEQGVLSAAPAPAGLREALVSAYINGWNDGKEGLKPRSPALWTDSLLAAISDAAPLDKTTHTGAAASLEDAGVGFVGACECGHPDICTPPSDAAAPPCLECGGLGTWTAERTGETFDCAACAAPPSDAAGYV